MADQRKPWTPIEIRFHHAIPGWCKLIGLRIREILECEGGGYMVPEADARLIAAAPDMADLLERWLHHFGVLEDNHLLHPTAVSVSKDTRALLAKIKGD